MWGWGGGDAVPVMNVLETIWLRQIAEIRTGNQWCYVLLINLFSVAMHWQYMHLKETAFCAQNHFKRESMASAFGEKNNPSILSRGLHIIEFLSHSCQIKSLPADKGEAAPSASVAQISCAVGVLASCRFSCHHQQIRSQDKPKLSRIQALPWQEEF